MKEYDLFIPLYYNDGTPIEGEKLRRIQDQLLSFDGLTFFPQANEGFWRRGGVMYRDQIVIYRLIASQPEEARAFLVKLKEELTRELRQEEILIIEREVRTL